MCVWRGKRGREGGTEQLNPSAAHRVTRGWIPRGYRSVASPTGPSHALTCCFDGGGRKTFRGPIFGVVILHKCISTITRTSSVRGVPHTHTHSTASMRFGMRSSDGTARGVWGALCHGEDWRGRSLCRWLGPLYALRCTRRSVARMTAPTGEETAGRPPRRWTRSGTRRCRRRGLPRRLSAPEAAGSRADGSG